MLTPEAVRLQMENSSKFQYVLAMLVASATYVVIVLFTCGAFGHQIGLFVNNTIKLSDKYNLAEYHLDVTPADWTFILVAFIYLWQAIWLLYGISTLFRNSQDGPVYACFPILPPIVYIVFSFSMACNVAWLLIWDKQYMEVALIFINLMTVTLYICLMVTMRRISEFGATMERQNMHKDIWAIRILVQNGLGLYASWGTVAAIFNFAIVLSYHTGQKKSPDVQEVGSTVALIIFTMELFTWFIFDNFVLEQLLRYLFSPYITILVSLIGIITNNFDGKKRNSVYCVILFFVALAMTVIKVVLVAWRHKHQPLFSPKAHKLRRPVVSFEVRGLLEQ